MPENSRESIAVVGGGITGVAASIELAKSQRFQVTLLEKETRLGGLSSSYRWQDTVCDRFYHVILPTDACLLEFLRDLGLESQLFWKRTRSGFYGDRGLTSFASAVDFLRFPYLSFFQKIRLGLGIFRSSSIKDLSAVDGLTAPEWLNRMFGPKVYAQFWEPLLLTKFGGAEKRLSASLVGAIIKRLYAARGSADKQERMGHVHGGYQKIWNAARHRLCQLDVTVRARTPVIHASIHAADNEKNRLSLTTSSGTEYYDKLLFTIPTPEILKTMPQNAHPFRNETARVEYIGVICVLLILRRSLSPYYVINLLDRELPFTGIIESTNVIPPEETGGRHLIYLPKYLTSGDPLHNLDDDDIVRLFLEKLKSVFPELKTGDILHKTVFRSSYTQPVQEPHRMEDPIGARTLVSNVYLANSTQILNTTLNNDAAVSVAQTAAKKIVKE